jgi:MFS family permease
MEKISRSRLGAITAGTMAIGTFPLIAFSVLAADFIEEFGISRAQVGLLVTSTALVGALASPYFGRLTDRMGAVRATRATLMVGAATMAGLASSPIYGVLLLAALVAGVGNGWSNPATNALIVENVPPGERGVVTGIKQAGVQAGIFLAGLLLPVFTALWNWRVALALFIVVPLAGLAGMAGVKDSTRHHHLLGGEERAVPVSVKWIGVYGTISGMATSAMLGFLPLFAEEDQLWSPTAAGSLVAAIGLTGVVARITWPSVAERLLGHGRTLRLLAFLSACSAGLLALAALKILPSWILVPAALLLAGGAMAWNAVGMLAVMDLAGPGVVGRGTGVVLLGFLLGYSAGAPLMGLSVDALGSYGPGWFVAAGLLLLASFIAGRVPAGSTLTAP